MTMTREKMRELQRTKPERKYFTVSREGSVKYAEAIGAELMKTGLDPKNDWWPELARLTPHERAGVRQRLAEAAAIAKAVGE